MNTPTGEVIAGELNLTLRQSLSLKDLCHSTLTPGSLLLAIQLPVPTELAGEISYGQILVDECHWVDRHNDLPLKPGFYVINKAVYDLLTVGRYSHWFYASAGDLYPLHKTKGGELMESLPIKLTRTNKDHLTRHVIVPDLTFCL